MVERMTEAKDKPKADYAEGHAHGAVLAPARENASKDYIIGYSDGVRERTDNRGNTCAGKTS